MGKSTPGKVMGRSLTLDLALSRGEDPFVTSVVAPVRLWANAVWRGDVPVRDLQVGLEATKKRLSPAKMPWGVARSPFDVYVLSLARGRI